MKTFHAFPLNPIDALASQVIIAGADGIAVASALKTINGQSLLGSGNISIIVDLTGYATTQYVDDEITANGVSLQSFASSASNLSTGTVADARLSSNVTLLGNSTTGAGNVVRATSPALTTPNIGVAAGLTLALSGSGAQMSIAPTAGTGGTATLKGLGSTSNELAGTGFMQVSGVSGVIVSVNGTEYQRTTATYGTVFRGYIGIGVDTGVPDVYYYRTSATAVTLANSGFKSRNLANNADAPISGSDITASGVAKFTGYPTGLLPAAASNAGSITYDTTLAKHVGCNGSSWNALW